ncbi:MAG: ABC transporter permease [Oscillospiraceae bacterium]
MSFVALIGSLQLGLLYSLVAIALYVSYRILNIADLSVDGTFPLGGAVAMLITAGGHPFLSIPAAILAGIAAGFITGFLQTKLKVPSILAGIITMTGLFSINLMIMGDTSTLSVSRTDETIFSKLEVLFGNKDIARMVVSLGVCLIIAAILVFFFRTRLGLSIRATGDNRAMVSASSINPTFTTIVGLCLANGLVALSGALISHYQRFADVTMGTGMVVIGLASLMIGEIIVGRGSVLRCILGAILGSVIYRVIIAFALTLNISPSNLKLVTAVIVALAISWPALKGLFAQNKRKRAAMKLGK